MTGPSSRANAGTDGTEFDAEADAGTDEGEADDGAVLVVVVVVGTASETWCARPSGVGGVSLVWGGVRLVITSRQDRNVCAGGFDDEALREADSKEDALLRLSRGEGVAQRRPPIRWSK